MMKKLILLACVIAPTLVTSSAVFAHAGHGIEGQVHGFLHIEHLLALLAIVAVILFAKAIKK